MEAVKKNNRNYYIALIFMLVFVFNDLIFDYLFSFDGSNIISFIFTLLASIIVFVWNKKLKKSKIKGEFEEISTFIKSNFDNWQVLFSVLDILCGLISIMSGFAMLACVFKFTKVIYVPTKILVVTNKEKSLIKAISKGSLIWTLGRTASKTKKGESKVKKVITNIKNNPKTIMFGLICSAVFGYASYLCMNNVISKTIPLWLNIAIIVLVAVVAFFGCCWIGWDKAKNYTLRTADKILNDENYDKLYKFCQDLETQQLETDKVAKELADKEKQDAIDRKKALKLAAAEEAKQVAEEEARAEKERLLALAAQIKAEEAAKTEDTKTEN